MPDNGTPSLLVFDDEHRRVLYVEGRVVGWTGTRAQYHWQIMSAPVINHEQIIFIEASPLTELSPFSYRGDAITALRRHAERNHLELMDRAGADQQCELRYSDALEQEIHELQERCRHIHLARRPAALLDRLHACEATLTQLRALLEAHFASQQADWVQIQSLLTCDETDAPQSP